MASDSIPRSLLEPPARQLVRHLSQQRLVSGIAPSQGIEADLAGIEVHLGADQAVRPRRIDLEVAAQQLDAAGGRRQPHRGQVGVVIVLRSITSGVNARNLDNFVQATGTTSTTFWVNADGVGTDFFELFTLQNVANNGHLAADLFAQGNLLL